MIWYHLYNLKIGINTHDEMLLLVKKLATLLKVTLLHDCFSRCFTNGTKLRKASQISLLKYDYILLYPLPFG